MSRAARRIPLGEVDPCGSRQAGRRSGATLTDQGPVVGLADGSVRAFDGGEALAASSSRSADARDDGAVRWSVEGRGSAIELVPLGQGVLVGERSARGAIRFLREGEERWRHEAADVVGGPAKQTRFFLPMVVDAAAGGEANDGESAGRTDGETAFVAARRYERRDGERQFESSIYALAPDGDVQWRYEADASPIAVEAFADGVAVAYNRCPGDHDDGLVVLDGDGEVRWTWDPDRTAQRRVGDVSAASGGLAVASHADYRGYRLTGGEVDWSVDLGAPLEDGDRVYAYPNHVHATDAGAVFLTGNSFPEEGRETDERHPREQSAFGYSPDGDERWRAPVGGFCHEVATDGGRVLAPVAQHFRERDPAVHGWRLLDVADGPVVSADCEGVVTAAALAGDRRALVEEPVRYHDDGEVRGGYALHLP
jgi:outer membrane protein assembly factor BamB